MCENSEAMAQDIPVKGNKSIATVCGLVLKSKLQIDRQQVDHFHHLMKKLRSKPEFTLHQFDGDDEFDSSASFENPELVKVELPKDLKISSDDYSENESYSYEDDFQSFSQDGETDMNESISSISYNTDIESNYEEEEEEEDETSDKEENVNVLKSEITVIGKIKEN